MKHLARFRGQHASPRYNGLECSVGVGEFKEHYHQFEESLISYECRLVLVFRYDSDRFVPPVDVDHGD